MRRLLAVVDREAANFAVIEGYAREYRKIPGALSTVGGWVPILQRPQVVVERCTKPRENTNDT
jgi:hypothetical protein